MSVEPDEAADGFLAYIVNGATFDPERTEGGPLTEVEQSLNRIAMWQASVLDGADPSVVEDHRAALRSLIRDVWALARKPFVSGWQIDQFALSEVSNAIDWLGGRFTSEGPEFDSAYFEHVNETGEVSLQGRYADGRLIEVSILIDEVYVESPEPEYEDEPDEDEEE